MQKTITFALTILLNTFLTGSLPAQNTSENLPLNLISHRIAEKQSIEEALYFFEQKDVVIRYQEIILNDQMKSSVLTYTGDEIQLNLFEDANYTATVTRTENHVNGANTFTAILKNIEGYAVFSTAGDRSLASIYLPNISMYYKIISDPGTHRHFLIEMNAKDRDILEGGPSLIPEITEKDLLEQKRINDHLKNSELGVDDLANVDVMVLYTPAADEWANTFGGGIENVVAIAMANAQLVLDNSKTLMTVTLKHSSKYNYLETGDSGTDLGEFTQSSEINLLRDQYKADLITIFTKINDVGGMGWLLSARTGNPDYGFCLTRVQQAADAYTHIHEMGHNMGCHHHKQQNFQPGPTIWQDWPENTWSAGHRWQAGSGLYYCSVMTYTSGTYFEDGINHTEVPYFSNPNVIHEGVFTGDAMDSDNAQTLRELKHVIASYRISELASIFTSPAGNIGIVSALSGGEITDDGGHAISQRGVVWDTKPNPTIELHKGITYDGEGIGSYTSELKDLIPATTYYVVAYAVSESGTAYGVQRLFNTMPAFRPNVMTTEAGIITHNAATTGGNVTQGGNSTVSARGIVWSTQPYPDITTHEGITQDGEGTGIFESQISGLMPETEYFYRAYATNLGGTNYGEQQSLTTLFARIFPNPFTDILWVEFYNKSEKDVTIVLKNMQGQIVQRKEVSTYGEVQELLNVTHLQSGLYVLSIESEFTFPVWQLIKPGN